MPRSARIKDVSGIYHIIIRSISEIMLFKDNKDKEKYLLIVKKYQKIFRFKVYSYCLMDNHAHFIIDCCGADISKIMKSLNQCYVSYFNKKYNRHGHLLQDRFKSKLIDSERYLLSLSAYIHNNPKDIKGYKNKVADYKFSSFGIYLGFAKDKLGILDFKYILGHFNCNLRKSRVLYKAFVSKNMDVLFKNINCSDGLADNELLNQGSQATNHRIILLRNFNPADIIDFVSKYTNTNFNIHIKFNHNHTELKSLCVLIMRSLCNYSYIDICNIIGNVTMSNLWKLCENGYKLITNDERYNTLIDDIIMKYSAA